MSAAYTRVFTVISFFNMFYFLFLFRFVLFCFVFLKLISKRSELKVSEIKIN